MATLKTQRARARAVNREALVTGIFNFIRKIETELVSYNVEQLNKKSADVIGRALGFYTPGTEYITTNDALLGKDVKIKRAGDPYDLDQTGELLNSIYLRIVNEVVIFGSNDPKLPLVLDNPQLEGKQLFGLTDDSLKEAIRVYILPFYLQFTKEKLML